jgi:hypothetical protein|mmetsp:Transcript_18545/g.32238  ORF Transcript_18545/g.32238 Transcript_18545/m.32238 type:complete len:113 (+) Transcript_18545:287-625(+)
MVAIWVPWEDAGTSINQGNALDWYQWKSSKRKNCKHHYFLKWTDPFNLFTASRNAAPEYFITVFRVKLTQDSDSGVKLEYIVQGRCVEIHQHLTQSVFRAIYTSITKGHQNE